MQATFMQGVTTAIVLFIFACVLFPKVIKHRQQFYISLVIVALVLLLDALGFAIGGGFQKFAIFVMMILNLFAFVLLVMAAGGLSLKELTGEIASAIEVMRRGEGEKEIIIPLSDADRAKIAAGGAVHAKREDDERTVYVIDDPGKAPPAGTDKKDQIPLE